MKRLLSFSAACFVLAITPLAHSQTQVVIPIDFAEEEGTSGGEGTSLGNFNNTVHTVYNESVLAAAGLNAGDVLTGLSFRVNGSRVAPNFSANDYIIRLSTSQNSAGNLEPTFADNHGTDLTVVRSGAITFDAADYDDSSTAPLGGPGTPNAFGPVITFDTTFTYQGGDLLLEYTHSPPLPLNGTVAESRSDAVTNFNDEDENPLVESLFGTGFDASEISNFTPAPGLATIVQFAVVPAPGLEGDFNNDEAVDCGDVDSYQANLGMPATGTLSDFDLVTDGVIDLADVEFLVTTLVVTSNGQTGTFLGDFNCDGQVDVITDAFILIDSLGSAVTSYSDGDANLDGTVDVINDAFVLIENLGETNTPAAP